MPERGARMPTRSGLFCAGAGANTPPDAKVPMAATEPSNLRREIAMVFLPDDPRRGSPVIVDRSSDDRSAYSSKHGACLAASSHLRCHLGRGAGAQKTIDLRAGKRPIVVEVGDDGPHECLRKCDGAFL